MKTKEELNQLKQEYESLATKLQELTEDELKQVTGGTEEGNQKWYRFNTDEQIKLNDTQYCKIISQGSSYLGTLDPEKKISISIYSIATRKMYMRTTKTAKYLDDCRNTYGIIE